MFQTPQACMPSCLHNLKQIVWRYRTMLHTNRNRITPPITTTVFTPIDQNLQVTRKFIGDRDANQVVAALMRCHNE